MLVLMSHPILTASTEELHRLKTAGLLTAEQIVAFRDPNGYCIFGTGEGPDALARRYRAIAAVFPEVFELLRWNPRWIGGGGGGGGFRCEVCGAGGGGEHVRVIEFRVCGHCVHYECGRKMERCCQCGLLVQQPHNIPIKHNWIYQGAMK